MVTGVLILILCLGGAPLHTILNVVDTKYSEQFTDFMYTDTILVVISNGCHHKFYRHLVVGSPPAMHQPIICNLKNKTMKFKVHAIGNVDYFYVESILLKNPANFWSALMSVQKSSFSARVVFPYLNSTFLYGCPSSNLSHEMLWLKRQKKIILNPKHQLLMRQMGWEACIQKCKIKIRECYSSACITWYLQLHTILWMLHCTVVL